MQIFVYVIINEVSENETDYCIRNNACYIILIIYTEFQESHGNVNLIAKWRKKMNLTQPQFYLYECIHKYAYATDTFEYRYINIYIWSNWPLLYKLIVNIDYIILVII